MPMRLVVGMWSASWRIIQVLPPVYTLHTPYIHPVFTLYTTYIHPIYTLYSPYIHSIFTLYTPYIHPIFTLYTPYIHPIFTLYSPYIHPIFTLLIGIWLFHCHISWHLTIGMATVLDTASETLWKRGVKLPKDFGTCGAINTNTPEPVWQQPLCLWENGCAGKDQSCEADSYAIRPTVGPQGV